MRLRGVSGVWIMVWVSLSTLIAAWTVPSESPARVFWEDGLEPGNSGYALVDGMSYSSNPVHAGTHSLKQHFLGNHVQSGSYSDRYLGASSEELWSRYYIFLDNFAPDAQVGTKIMNQGEECCYPSFWWIMPFGQTTLTVTVQGVHGGTETYNVSGGNLPQNRWACVETRIRMSSPGASNGIVEAWIDGNQVIARYDLPMRDATASGRNSPTAKFTYNRLYVQFGQGDLYYDSLALGDQRIGCSGIPPQSNSPSPAAPTPPAETPHTPSPQPAQPALIPPPAPEGLFFY